MRRMASEQLVDEAYGGCSNELTSRQLRCLRSDRERADAKTSSVPDRNIGQPMTKPMLVALFKVLNGSSRFRDGSAGRLGAQRPG